MHRRPSPPTTVLLAVDPAVKIAWFRFQAVWQLPAVTAITCFVLDYANPGRWLTRRILIVLSIPPLLTLVQVLTNDLHHWHWLGFSVGNSVVPLRGPGFWVVFAYGLGLMLDADGVALAAIQGLYAENQALKAQVAELDARLTVLEQSAQAGRAVRPGGLLPWLLGGRLVVAGGTAVTRIGVTRRRAE